MYTIGKSFIFTAFHFSLEQEQIMRKKQLGSQMMQCPRCDFENTDRHTYCDRCGTLLQGFAPYSPEMEHNISPSSEYGLQSQAFSNEKLYSRPRITVLRVIRGILYFIATPIAALGLIG